MSLRDTPLYCVEWRARNGYAYFTYTNKDNINQLAVYLNNTLMSKPTGETVVEVSLVKNYDDDGVKIFFPTEYQDQYFLESYEERLVEQHRIESYLV
jgi:hypothetical protein